jgi:hypothetical protein
LARVDPKRLSKEHQEYLARVSAKSEHFKMPKAVKPELIAYGETFDSLLEVDFAHTLERWRKEGKIDSWLYHPLRFRLAPNVTYTPDFLAFSDTDTLSGAPCRAMYEVKGSWKAKGARDSRTRLKIAAHLYQWFNWYGVTREKNIWQFETIHANEGGEAA